MQIAETLNQGLRREYSLVIPAAAIAARVDTRLAEVSKTIRMPGFRPGKVPPNLVRKMHGDALRGEALQAAVNDSVQQLLSDSAVRPATQPQVDLEGNPGEGDDVAIKVSFEILPTVTDINIDGLTLEKLVVAPDEDTINEALTRLSAQDQRSEPAPANHKAKTGDTVVIDFEGRVDGKLFDGGKGEGMRVTIGSGQLIPGFEDQLIGAKANDERVVKVTFPADYNVATLKGQPAEFAIVVRGVEKPVETVIDDEFAKGFGIDSLDALKEILKDQLDTELGNLTRTHLKRKLLDTLAARHDFEVPESMVDSEFGQIWAQIEQEISQDADPEAMRTQMEAERGDYRRIAERRVRLGLLLSEIGQRNNVSITQAELNRLIGQEAARYPGEQQKVVKFLQENPMALAQLRAPLYEDKVVDFLIAKAELTERFVSRGDLEAAIEDEDETPGLIGAGHDHGHVHGPDCDHDHDHAPAKPATKKAAKAKPATTEAAPVEAATETAAEAQVKKAVKSKAAKVAEPVEDAPVVEAPAKPKKVAKKAAE
jgi:trigger factor